MEPKYFTTEHFECRCMSDEHMLKFTLDETCGDIEDLEIWTSVFLHKYEPLWKRVWIALKYIFGYNCRYGHWDCFIMRGEDVDRMMLLLVKYKAIEAKLIAKQKAKECLGRAFKAKGSDDMGQYNQECGPFPNDPENFDNPVN